jgi:cytochrome c553
VFVVILAMVVSLLMAGSPVAAQDVEAGRRKAETCAACHGVGGNSTIPAVPSLAGQRPIYLHWQLMLYRDGRRKDPQMAPLAANLSDADMADVAAYYAEQRPARPPAGPNDPEKIAAGQRLAEAYNCIPCHTPRGGGQHYPPRLTALHFEYLREQLHRFRTQTRGELDGTMTMAARPLSEQDVDLLAHYLATLPPAP